MLDGINNAGHNFSFHNIRVRMNPMAIYNDITHKASLLLNSCHQMKLSANVALGITMDSFNKELNVLKTGCKGQLI